MGHCGRPVSSAPAGRTDSLVQTGAEPQLGPSRRLQPDLRFVFFFTLPFVSSRDALAAARRSLG